LDFVIGFGFEGEFFTGFVEREREGFGGGSFFGLGEVGGFFLFIF
jgi:hypothetical protein